MKKKTILITLIILALIGVLGYVVYYFTATDPISKQAAQEQPSQQGTLAELAGASTWVIEGVVIDDGVSSKDGFVDYGLKENYELKGNTTKEHSDSEGVTATVLRIPVDKNGKKPVELAKDQSYIVFATTDENNYVRAMADDRAIAKKISNDTYELPSDIGIVGKRTFTLDEIRQKEFWANTWNKDNGWIAKGIFE